MSTITKAMHLAANLHQQADDPTTLYVTAAFILASIQCRLMSGELKADEWRELLQLAKRLHDKNCILHTTGPQ